MINRFFVTGFLFCQVISFGSLAQNKFILSGTFPAQYNSKYIYLELSDYYSNNKYTRIDSTQIKGSKFHFEGSIPRIAERANLYIKDSKGRLTYSNGIDRFFSQIVIDKGTNTVIVKQVDTIPVENKLKHMLIPHSGTNRLMMQFDSLHSAYMRLYAVPNKENPEYTTTPLDKQIQMQYEYLRILKRDPTNYYALIYLRFEIGLGRLSEDTLLKAFYSLSPELKASDLGREISTILNDRIKRKKESQIGQTVPKFRVATFEGKIFDNNDLAGMPYLIVFSATWCVPCQKELPILKELYNRYHNQGLEVVYFNLDDNEKIWAEHIKKNNLQWINVSERTKRGISVISELFYVYAIPKTFLITPSGKIAYVSLSTENLEENIKKLLR